MEMVPRASTPLVFTFPETAQPVRTLMVDGDPWWFAADVCAVLGIANVGNALARIDEADKSSIRIADGTPGNPNKAVVNESGLYDLILDSRKPEARAFRRWITAEVLPSLRQTGSYSVEPITSGSAEVMPSHSQALRGWAAELEAREVAEARVAELEPAAESWNVLATADGDLSVGDAAKILSRDPNIKVGQNRLFTVLREFGWVYRQQLDNRHRAFQAQIDLGRLSELPSSHYHPRTAELVLDAPQLRITVKGLAELHKRLGGSDQMQIGGA